MTQINPETTNAARVRLDDDKSNPVVVDLEGVLNGRMLVAANSGSGKTWLLRKFLEGVIGKMQVIVLDIEGEFSGLREHAEILLAGRHGELPVDVETAAVLATGLHAAGVSCVVDLTELRVELQPKFVARFVNALMSIPEEEEHPVLLVVDEAQVLCPQNGGDAECASAIKNVACRGRKREIAVVLATQRLAEVNKGATSQAKNIFVGGCSDVDMVRAGELLGMVRSDYRRLHALEPGQFYATGPAVGGRGPVLFRAGAPVSRGGRRRGGGKSPAVSTPKALEALLPKLREAMAVSAASGEVYDMAEARAEIARLRGELTTEARRARSPEEEGELQGLREQVAALAAEVGDRREAHEKALRGLASLAEQARALHRESECSFEMNEASAGYRFDAPVERVSQRVRAPEEQAELGGPVHSPVKLGNVGKEKKEAENGGADPVKLGRCERALLEAIWSGNDGRTRSQVAILSGYSVNSSTFGNALSSLRSGGLIEKRGERFWVTASGAPQCAGMTRAPRRGAALFAMWCQKLGKASRTMIECLRHNNGTMTREGLSAASGYSITSSTFTNALSELRTLELISGKGNEAIKLSEMLL